MSCFTIEMNAYAWLSPLLIVVSVLLFSGVAAIMKLMCEENQLQVYPEEPPQPTSNELELTEVGLEDESDNAEKKDLA